jgi:pSer/pThr/pTyr-binding forkhead associated (FHA) protein
MPRRLAWGESNMADLCVLTEDGAVAQRWAIGDQPAAVGRDDTADITIHDDTLSRRHFMIWREGDIFLIKDLNSQNGTCVDGQRVQGATLRHDVCIAAGHTLFMFSEHDSPTRPPGVLPAALAEPPAAGGTRTIASGAKPAA